MATLQELKIKIDQKLVQLWPEVEDRQQNYLSSHGRYWQGIRNPFGIPADGVELPLDLSLCPTDQLENWAVFNLPLPATFLASLQIDIYHSPFGHGFVAIVWIWYQNRLFSRAQQLGPEIWRSIDWRDVTPD